MGQPLIRRVRRRNASYLFAVANLNTNGEMFTIKPTACQLGY
jgi:hypothetical protein